MEGPINSTLRYLADDGCIIPDWWRHEQLYDKHPKPQPAKLGSLLFGPVEEVYESAYNEVTGEMITEAAKRT